jgi:hypothetical protein
MIGSTSAENKSRSDWLHLSGTLIGSSSAGIKDRNWFNVSKERES